MTDGVLGYDKYGYSKDALKIAKKLLKSTGLEFRVIGMIDIDTLDGINFRTGLAYYEDLSGVKQFCDSYTKTHH